MSQTHQFPSQSEEYWNHYLLVFAKDSAQKFDNFSLPSEITPRHRQKVIDWMHMIVLNEQQYKTRELACIYFNIYINDKEVPLNKIQLVGACCCLIAIKYYETKEINYLPQFNDVFSQEEQNLIENDILTSLSWNLNRPTVQDYLEMFQLDTNVFTNKNEAFWQYLNFQRYSITNDYEFQNCKQSTKACIIIQSMHSMAQDEQNFLVFENYHESHQLFDQMEILTYFSNYIKTQQYPMENMSTEIISTQEDDDSFETNQNEEVSKPNLDMNQKSICENIEDDTNTPGENKKLGRIGAEISQFCMAEIIDEDNIDSYECDEMLA